MSDVFISYAREDSSWAASVAAVLEGHALSVFWDTSIAVGDRFEQVIEAELLAAKAVVVLWSIHSVSSEWVRAEAAAAAERGVLIPASLDDTSLPLRYRSIQTADLSRWHPDGTSDEYDRFIRGVIARARAVSESAPLQIPSSRPRPSALTILIGISLVWAWLGALALAAAMAFDYGFVHGAWALHLMIYRTVYICVLGGGLSSGVLGAISLRRRFMRGVLQGWILPVATAFCQLVLLMGVSEILRRLPSVSESDALVAFLVCGALGPAVLTMTAVGTLRQDRNSRKREVVDA